MARLLDPKKNGRFPFRWVPSAKTNVANTFDRLCPGWRRRPEPQPGADVVPIRKAKA